MAFKQGEPGGPPKDSRPKDKQAADKIRRLRVNQGLSLRDLAAAIEEKGVAAGYDAARVAVSPDLLYLIEKRGHIPGPRIKFAIAFFFDLRPGQVWRNDALAGLTPPLAPALAA